MLNIISEDAHLASMEDETDEMMVEAIVFPFKISVLDQ